MGEMADGWRQVKSAAKRYIRSWGEVKRSELSIDYMTPCDYIGRMKKSQKKADASAPYPMKTEGTVFSVREAKASFSALSRRAAAGEEITITWHGRAWARLAPIRPDSAAFRVDRVWLNTMPRRKQGVPSETLVRVDRDARG
jgi:prevent-host-death family protein